MNRIGSIELFEDDKIEKQFEDKETKIGQKITETTSKKIIIIVLIIMISIPIFSINTYISEFNYFQSCIDTLHNLANRDGFALDDALFNKNWDYLVSKRSYFNVEMVNLRLVKNIGTGEETEVLKEYGSNSKFDNYRNYEFDGRNYSNIYFWEFKILLLLRLYFTFLILQYLVKV